MHRAVHLDLPPRIRQNGCFNSGSWWNPARVEEAERLWKEGLSASQIAKKMGAASRNVIIGMAYRRGWTGREVPSKPARTVRLKKPHAPPKPKLTLIGPTVFLRGEEHPPRVASRAMSWSPLEGVPPIPLVEVKTGLCRWPVDLQPGEHFACGAACGEETYCDAHHDLAVSKTKPKAKTANDLARSLRRYAA